MPVPLSNVQKTKLAMLAREAWVKAGRPGDANEWRQEQVIAAVGKHGLRCCDQGDYGFVKARFLDLLGQPGKAIKADVRQQNNDKRIVEYKLLRELEALGRPMTYANAIARTMFHGLALLDCSTDQLWKVFFALRKQNQKKRDRANAA